ncbi:M23 family metallopeptidase [Massilibacteroides sp.]|uniref:M23 family metallopeptidase n=1 Tax=Massilibacteroides sp. TaxID=2034766 RepID=UPI00260E6687|nr:M23 family metallopeptidase [Massilibacteroides sp.]MDD4514483.1 M23 family metallopeptidase [Massilibacteroides sp.]
MTVIKKVILIIFYIGILAGITTCSTRKNVQVTNKTNIYPVKYPSLVIPTHSAELIAEFPTPPQPALQKAERRPVTTKFSAFQTKHVKATDPLLFNSGNTIIIDFSTISEQEYAFPLPGGKVISDYGGRRRGHSGIDIKTCAKDTIVSAFDGIVRMAAPYAAYGNVIVVRHYNGLETVYSHNSKNLVKPGDPVKAGEPIALTGRTGRATTEHLHFEIRINGEHVNPNIFFDFSQRILRKESYLCVRNGQKITVNKIDPFPYQEQYLSSYH